MLKKMNALAVRIYSRGYCFIQGLKEDERGLSGVVVAILLILVAVLAVSLLWNKLSFWLGTTWDSITSKADAIT